jgi:hypothetical protein
VSLASGDVPSEMPAMRRSALRPVD